MELVPPHLRQREEEKENQKFITKRQVKMKRNRKSLFLIPSSPDRFNSFSSSLSGQRRTRCKTFLTYFPIHQIDYTCPVYIDGGRGKERKKVAFSYVFFDRTLKRFSVIFHPQIFHPDRSEFKSATVYCCSISAFWYGKFTHYLNRTLGQSCPDSFPFNLLRQNWGNLRGQNFLNSAQSGRNTHTHAASLSLSFCCSL